MYKKGVSELSDDTFQELAKQLSGTRIISVVQRGDSPPTVQWDPSLSENDVIANLLKALLFMTLDEYVSEMLDDMLGEEESDEEG